MSVMRRRPCVFELISNEEYVWTGRMVTKRRKSHNEEPILSNTSLVFAFVVLCFIWTADAQEFTGNINGRVTDGTGAVIPGVTVTIKSPAMQGEKQTITDESGGYRFNLLTQGNYTVTYQLPGFKTLIREGVVVSVGRTTTLNIALEVATLAATVTVTGESPVVDVQNATVGVNFNQSLLRDLPNARDIWVVLSQTPGITTTRFDVVGSTMGTQTGYRSYGFAGQNWVTLDGINTTEERSRILHGLWRVRRDPGISCRQFRWPMRGR